jgi:hypothetical protein
VKHRGTEITERGEAKGACLVDQSAELFTIQAAISQYLAQQPWPDCFAGVDRDDGSTTICMPQEVMAAANPHDYESTAFQRLDYFRSRQRR